MQPSTTIVLIDPVFHVSFSGADTERVLERLNQLENVMATMNQRLEAAANKVESLSTGMGDVSTNLGALITEVGKVKVEVQTLKDSIGQNPTPEQEATLSRLETALGNADAAMTGITTAVTTAQAAVKEVDDINEDAPAGGGDQP